MDRVALELVTRLAEGADPDSQDTAGGIAGAAARPEVNIHMEVSKVALEIIGEAGFGWVGVGDLTLGHGFEMCVATGARVCFLTCREEVALGNVGGVGFGWRREGGDEGFGVGTWGLGAEIGVGCHLCECPYGTVDLGIVGNRLISLNFGHVTGSSARV